MTTGTAGKPSQRDKRTIILFITQEEYEQIVLAPQKFRAWIDKNYRLHPEIFPENFNGKYTLHDHSTSSKTALMTRRIKLKNGEKGEVWSICPSFVMPYMIGYTEDVAKVLYLRKYGVPYEGLVYVFGRDENYWYRLEVQFGRLNIVATTIKTVEIPVDLLADEHHSKLNGDKIAIATTVTHGVVLGAEVSPGFSTDDLKASYGVFAREAKEVDPEYAPSTVNTDGYAATIGAWQALFPMVVLIRCFLHAWFRIRDRSKTLENFFELGTKVWNVFYSTTRRMMSQRIRRLRDWAMKNLSGVALAKTLDLCNKQAEWSLWYDNENAYTTSNELDRLMRSQNRYFDRGQHFHGTLESANLRSRAWAILHNYWDWGRKTRKANEGYRCPAERLNDKRYADCWLENLLVATSAVQRGKKQPLNPA
jgi:hypothetical protein